MIKKTELRKQAILMRKRRITYSGIMDKVPVAKSTLALWFKEVKLSKPQLQRLTKAKLEAGLRGGAAKKEQRIARMQKIIATAENEVGAISKRELWLIGITLYWAEGAKEKEWAPGNRVSFINMDSTMVKTFLKWLRLCGVKDHDLSFGLYIHENHNMRLAEIKKHWVKVTGFPVTAFGHVYWKRNKVATKRKNIKPDSYFGIIKIIVKQSSSFLRKITGWTNGIYKGINNG